MNVAWREDVWCQTCVAQKNSVMSKLCGVKAVWCRSFVVQKVSGVRSNKSR